MKRAAITLSCLLAVSSVHADQPRSKGEVIERIVAVVNGDPLLLSDLRQRAAPFLPRLMQAPELQRSSLMVQLYEELLTQMVDERLLEQEARKLTISVTGADIDRAVDNVRRQSNLSDKEFWQAVSTQGFTPEQYKSDVRRQLLRLKVINQKVRARVNITENDVRRRYDAMLRDARKSSRFHAAHVFLAADAGSATQLAEVRAKADVIHRTLTPEKFDEVIASTGGGDLGWVSQGDLPASLAETLIALEPGQISEPVRGPAGIHIFLLREREEGAASIAGFPALKDKIYEEMVEQAMSKQETSYLKELRSLGLISRRL